MVIVAFDVDGCLYEIVEKNGQKEERAKEEVLTLVRMLKRLGAHIIVWSGGGQSYAEMWVRKLWIGPYVDRATSKPEPKHVPVVDICFDDEEVTYGRVNFKV